MSPEVNLLSHFSTIKYLKRINFWSPLAPLLGTIDMCAHWLYCTKFNAQQLLFEAFFNITDSFGSVEHELNLLSHFSAIEYLKHINFWSPLAPLLGTIDMCAQGLYCTKFNSQQLLFEAFFNIIGSFGSVEPWTESTFPFQYNKIFETYQFLELLAPLLGAIDICNLWVFCTKFNS